MLHLRSQVWLIKYMHINRPHTSFFKFFFCLNMNCNRSFNKPDREPPRSRTRLFMPHSFWVNSNQTFQNHPHWLYIMDHTAVWSSYCRLFSYIMPVHDWTHWHTALFTGSNGKRSVGVSVSSQKQVPCILQGDIFTAASILQLQTIELESRSAVC